MLEFLDGVPTMIPTQLGYRHLYAVHLWVLSILSTLTDLVSSGAEYWQYAELGRNLAFFSGLVIYEVVASWRHVFSVSLLSTDHTKPMTTGAPKNVKRFERGEDPNGSANIRMSILIIHSHPVTKGDLAYSIHGCESRTLGLLSTA